MGVMDPFSFREKHPVAPSGSRAVCTLFPVFPKPAIAAQEADGLAQGDSSQRRLLGQGQSA